MIGKHRVEQEAARERPQAAEREYADAWQNRRPPRHGHPIDRPCSPAAAPRRRRATISIPTAKSGRTRRRLESNCSRACALISTPEMTGSSGVARRSSSPGALVPMMAMRPSSAFFGHLALQHVGGGDRALRIVPRERQPELAVLIGRNDGFADGDRRDASIAGKAAIAGRSHAQRLGRHRRRAASR